MAQQMDLPVTVQTKPRSIGGGLEGASRTSRELGSWSPALISPDAQINPAKDIADARGAEIIRNDGYAMGVVSTHKDSIVGSMYRLNARPNAKLLGTDESWAEEFQTVIEERFNTLADSEEYWFDAARKNTFTGLVRLAVGGFLYTGEVLATAEWMRQRSRPFRTAIQMIQPIRLCNPDGRSDDRFLKKGVHVDRYGAAVGYHFRQGHPYDMFDDLKYTWKYVPAFKPWGRRQVIHIIEQLQPSQTRGIADMVSVLSKMHMTKRFQEITLQNAVVNATYAAAIESELPSDMVYSAMGAGQGNLGDALDQYMAALTAYVGSSENIAIDGVKMPHLFPGTKLNLKPVGTPGGVGTDFESSLLRHIAAALGLSYEQLSRDYSKTNYSSARASMAETWKFMQSRKRHVADGFANMVYSLVLEEEINAGNVPLPPGSGPEIFYDPVKRAALLQCSWIGASRGQIDELKETQSAILRINANLSTVEEECARLGKDYREIFAQRSREQKAADALGLKVSDQTTKPGASDLKNTHNGDGVSSNNDDGDEE